jgi:hypothetical protein
VISNNEFFIARFILPQTTGKLTLSGALGVAFAEEDMLGR